MPWLLSPYFFYGKNLLKEHLWCITLEVYTGYWFCRISGVAGYWFYRILIMPDIWCGRIKNIRLFVFTLFKKLTFCFPYNCIFAGDSFWPLFIKGQLLIWPDIWLFNIRLSGFPWISGLLDARCIPTIITTVSMRSFYYN